MRTIMCVWLAMFLHAGGGSLLPGPGIPLRKDFEEAVVYLSGAASIEELSEDEIERYRHYENFPLRLNLLSGTRLLSSGLLSQYRVASLLDYRSRYGDVLSLSELAAVDGFGEEFVSALAPFVSFESSMLPGEVDREGILLSHDAVSRSGVRWNGGEFSSSQSARYSLRVADSFESGLAVKLPDVPGLFTGNPDVSGSFYASYDGGRHLSRLVVGAFNCRFGQGLAMWSGFSLGSTVTASTISRNPGFISPYRGLDWSSSLRGAGATFTFASRHTSAVFLNAFAAHPGVAGLNGSWLWRTGQVGLTGYVSIGRPSSRLIVDDAKLSADFRWNLRGTDFFGEAALDLLHLSPAFIAGIRTKPSDWLKLAFSLRYYDVKYTSGFAGAMRSSTKCSDEHALLLVGDLISSDRRHSGSFSSDLSHRRSHSSPGIPGIQSKSAAIYNYKVCEYLDLSFRAAYRFRDWESDHHKASLRTELKYSSGNWSASSRAEAQFCSSFSGLLCADLGWSHSVFTVYGRLGVFHADKWADRLYCYERDAPGNFNVPALYGRGLWTSAMMSLKFPFGLKVYLRAATTQFPRQWLGRTDTAWKSKEELRLQLNYSFTYRRR